ncbi:hypothetical protein IJG28_02835 [Candidatus Saccharibacteria bacterium]|nr:hypothetical protein [Candidatus Saccharibacteria bacterium]
MSGKKSSKFGRFRAWIASFLVLMGLFSGVVTGVLGGNNVYAVPGDGGVETTETVERNETSEGAEGTSTNSKSVTTGDSCKDSLGALGWVVCPVTEKVAEAVDSLYKLIEDFLVIDPISTEDGTPVYEIWKYCRGITNIVFIIFLLIVIYSQITGYGISNYGVKKALPKLIVAAIMVNLSFLICLLAVDVSNIIGSSIRGLFASVQESTLAVSEATSASVSYGSVVGALVGGSLLSIGGVAIAFEAGAIWMLIPVILGAIVAVASGLITIALRQAVVVLLIMVAPLAMVANILPNTEQWFKKWKGLFTRMLVFYPMFSLLFGASSLAGFAIIMSAKSAFGVLLGMAVQIFPLFFSWKLMQMSGTFLGDINSRIRGVAAKPLAANRAWADSHRVNKRSNTVANGVTPSARLMRYLDERRALREEDTKNALGVTAGKASEYVQRKIAASEIGDTTSRVKRTSRYTRNAKAMRNYSLMAQNAASHTDHVMGNYGSYFDNGRKDKELNEQAQRAWIDYGRAAYQKDIDDENDINFLVDRYLAANKRDANNKPVDEEAFNRYVRSVVGPDGEERLNAKIIAQAAKVESKQRAEFNIFYAKYGHNGYNKSAYRSFITGYLVNDDGWAVDANGKRLKNADGSYVEIVQGDALTKAPEKLVLYDKRDEQGLYYDFKDQNGNIVARVHRGTGADGKNHDDAAYIKETMANYDIPIADPINNVYSILAGIKPGDIVTPQGVNEIGLSRYSTTIGRAMSNYKSNAAWAGAMFNSGIGNRQIKNSSQHAIWVLDSIKKTLKPGAFNTQNPASVKYITSILDPDNWEQIFTEEELINAVNINNELVGGEDWDISEDGIINYTPVDNPTYEQRMNTLKRKLLFPAMKKVLPAFDRLRTSNTADNQKPGTADEQYDFLKMVEDKWENNPAINFDPTLVDQDLQSAAREFRLRKHDKDGNLIYATEAGNHRRGDGPAPNLLNALESVYDNSMIVEELKSRVFDLLSSREEYQRALMRFEELCNENPEATMREMYDWFTDLDLLVH